MIALLLATRLRRGYLHALEKSLVERAIELDPSLVEDSATRSVLMQSVELRLPIFADVPRPPSSAAAAGRRAIRSCAGRPIFVPVTPCVPSALPPSFARTIGPSRHSLSTCWPGTK